MTLVDIYTYDLNCRYLTKKDGTYNFCQPITVLGKIREKINIMDKVGVYFLRKQNVHICSEDLF